MTRTGKVAWTDGDFVPGQPYYVVEMDCVRKVEPFERLAEDTTGHSFVIGGPIIRQAVNCFATEAGARERLIRLRREEAERLRARLAEIEALEKSP